MNEAFSNDGLIVAAISPHITDIQKSNASLSLDSQLCVTMSASMSYMIFYMLSNKVSWVSQRLRTGLKVLH